MMTPRNGFTHKAVEEKREDTRPGVIDINYKDDGKEGAMQPLNHHEPQTTLQK